MLTTKLSTLDRKMVQVAVIVSLVGLFELSQPRVAEAAVTCMGPGEVVCLPECPVANVYCNTCEVIQQACEEQITVGGPCERYEFAVFCNYQT